MVSNRARKEIRENGQQRQERREVYEKRERKNVRERGRE